MVQSQIKLMMINFKFEASVLQVKIGWPNSAQNLVTSPFFTPCSTRRHSKTCEPILKQNRVGQSREIYSNSVPLSPPHWPYPKRIRPPSWPRVAVASSIQNIKLFTWRTWPGAGAVPKWDWAARSQCGSNSISGAPITQSTINMLRRMANPLSLLNWWLHKYDNGDDYALFQV